MNGVWKGGVPEIISDAYKIESASSDDTRDLRRLFGRGRIGRSGCIEDVVSEYCNSSGEGGEYVGPVMYGTVSLNSSLV